MIDQKLFAQYTKDPTKFHNDLLIDADGVVCPYGECMDDWQRTDFDALTPAILKVTGRKRKLQAHMRAYWERGRGHDKTSGIATVSINLLAFANRPLRGYCFAADKDQAGLLKDAVATKIRLNPWLGEILEVQRDCIVNIAQGHPGKGGTLTIFTSDVGSSYGILPDFIVCDELTHWGGDGSLWHSIISSAAKRSNCLMLVIANAGFVDSWQWSIREAIRNDPNWIFSRLDGPVASWITEDRLAEQRRMLPAIAYQRLWMNQWSASGGDALSPADIERAFNGAHQPMFGDEKGWRFVAGVDLGLTRDNSAVVVLAVNEVTGSLRLAKAMLWTPKQSGGKVQIEQIEKAIIELDRQFNLETIAIDPWQAEHLGQRLETITRHRTRSQRKHMGSKSWVRMIPPSSTNLREQASTTIETFQDGRIKCYDYSPLKNDLLKLRVEEKSYGLRLSSPRDNDGHGDTFSAFALALLVAHETSTTKKIKVGAIDMDEGDDSMHAMLRRYCSNPDKSQQNAYFEQQIGFLNALEDQMRSPSWGNWITD